MANRQSEYQLNAYNVDQRELERSAISIEIFGRNLQCNICEKSFGLQFSSNKHATEAVQELVLHLHTEHAIDRSNTTTIGNCSMFRTYITEI